MRSRRTNPQLQEAVSRRLALLSAELAGVRAARADERADPVEEGSPDSVPRHTVDPELAVAFRAWEVPADEQAGAPQEPVEPRLSPGPGFPGRHAARRRAPSLTAVVPEHVRYRLALGPAQFAVLAVIVALGLGLTAWWAIRSRPVEVSPPGDLVARAADQPLPTESPLLDLGQESAGSVQPTELVVDVSGKVRRPGIAVLEPGARVIDALKAAGGARRGADLGALNLARLVIDGEQILVGVPPPTGVGAAAAASPSGTGTGALVNINLADQPELETLPGIGPVTAQAIMAWRTEHNGFGAVEELLDVQGIGEATLAQLAPHVTI